MMGHISECSCGCDCLQGDWNRSFRRRFVSQTEIIARLEEYLKELRFEAEGVQERIAELKKR